MASTIRVKSIDTVYNGWAKVKRAVIDYRRRDGRWEEQTRELYDRGDGATIIHFDPARGTVLLVRQFRFVAHARGMDADLIEACAGLLDADDPETAIRREAEEELGYRLRSVRHLYTPLMSPGSVTERLSFFTAEYSPDDKVSDGGGHPAEGEDIEVVEISLSEALAAVADGRIVDAKTIMLLQHLRLVELERQVRREATAKD